MIWKGGLASWRREERRIQRIRQWHRWFAWYPVRLGDSSDGHKVFCWLETIERQMKRGDEIWDDWDYEWYKFYRRAAGKKGAENV